MVRFKPGDLVRFNVKRWPDHGWGADFAAAVHVVDRVDGYIWIKDNNETWVPDAWLPAEGPW